VKYSSNNYSQNNIEEFKVRMLNWADRFNIFAFLDSNHYQSTSSNFEWKLAAGVRQIITTDNENVFAAIKEFHLKHPGWLFGHISYPSVKPDNIGFHHALFFVPEIIITCSNNSINIESCEIPAELIYQQINQFEVPAAPTQHKLNFLATITQDDYIKSILKIKNHIQRGDCYEMNYCQEFIAQHAVVNPVSLFFQLTAISPNPFSALYKNDDKYCICASPERFITKKNTTVISQPIKGTSIRIHDNTEADEFSKNNLLNSSKERSENVMIVDLVRNDLSKIANEGSVKVAELFGIYSFPQVHQMISTITCETDLNTHWTEILEATYPMGSMTGAPKKKVMELTEAYEATPRGLFSGTIGYVCPNGDFDFNVVIRSIFYNRSKKIISYKVGGGITINSDPLQEYHETLIKAAAIKEILQA
jgi:para-aminobenzoate synthetase component 1